ncbi:triose-phosphate isomerase [Candidatus Woesearchaeota archaeon]|nr:triose-phosphate isomerase [Candidatus Woesearchaeota archaeon]
MKPLFILNFKLYPEAAGTKALRLIDIFSKVKSQRYELILAPPTSLLGQARQRTGLPLLAQHSDPVLLGAYTGHISPQELKLLGIEGTLLNHSERRIPLAQIAKTIALCQKHRRMTVVCASTLAEIKKIARLHPDAIAYEPPALIGGSVSVTSAKPEIIADAVRLVHRISPLTTVLCGAGVHTREDVKAALSLGTRGVLIGHAVLRARKPGEKIRELMG